MIDVIKKIFIKILLLLVALYSIKNLYLSYFGATTTGYITNTSQRVYNSEDSEGEIYQNTAHYFFVIDDKKYESQVSYKTGMPIVRIEDQEIQTTTVQYIKGMPYFSTLKKYNDDSFTAFIMWLGLIIICFYGMLKKDKIKKADKKKVTKVKAEPIEKKEVVEKKAWTCTCGSENEGDYCNICGEVKQNVK